jgi:hypothetical protein
MLAQLSPRVRILLGVGVLLFLWPVWLLLFTVYQQVVELPKAGQEQRVLDRELQQLTPLPSAQLQRQQAVSKPGSASISSYYVTDQSPGEIRAYYHAELVRYGWLFREERALPYQGGPRNVTRIQYCKETYCAVLTYGPPDTLGWSYAFALSWGLCECP